MSYFKIYERAKASFPDDHVQTNSHNKQRF